MKCITLKTLKLSKTGFFFTVYIMQFVQADLLQTASTLQQSKINNSYSYLWVFSRVHFKHQRQIKMCSFFLTSMWLHFHPWGNSTVPVRYLRENNSQHICLNSMTVGSTICFFSPKSSCFISVPFKYFSPIMPLFLLSVLWLDMTTFCIKIYEFHKTQNIIQTLQARGKCRVYSLQYGAARVIAHKGE